MDFHQSPRAMARVLVQYIACDKRVRSEVLSHFGGGLDLSAIAEIRLRHTNKLKHDARRDDSVTWMDQRFATQMDAANRRFVRALYSVRRVA